MATGAVSCTETAWYHCPVHHGIHRSLAPAWRWLCLVYAALGVVVMTGHVHLGVRLPGLVPEMVWGLVWLVCAAGTWQDEYASVRGSLSILAPALSTVSYGLDVVLTVFGPPAPRPPAVVSLAHCVMWAGVCMLIHTITRLDQPRD